MGVVYLVGAGPGDPGLLTLRAARLLRRADVVVYDALANDRLLDLVPPSAQRIDVGKRGGGRHTPQEEIHRLLIEAAGRATVVVRLKGGDPFVFGRGGEEALALVEAGFRFEVVPGVTAGIGAAAYAGIPLTNRGVASAVTLVAGHEERACRGSRIGWHHLAGGQRTVVIYMGIKRLPEIVDDLLGAGRSPDTPAAVVEWGTYPFQRTVTAPLQQIAERVEREGVGAPAIVVVGEVVALREQLGWFERRPLFGRRIVVPRSRPQPSRLAEALTGLGADVTEFPRIHLLPARDPEPLRRAQREIGSYEWVIFTSSTAVARFWAAWRAEGLDARALAGVPFACFGAATAAALLRSGIRADVVRTTYDPSVAAEALGRPRKGARILFPGAASSRSTIAARLAERGFLIDEVEAYRQVSETGGEAELRRRLDEGEVDLVAFTSSYTVRSFVDAIGAHTGRASVAAIGPETARTALSYGIPVNVVPVEHTLQGLVNGVLEYAANEERLPGAPETGAAPRRPRVAPEL